MEFPVQFIEHNVGEYRRERAALRHAPKRPFGVLAHAHPGLEVAVDEPQERPVVHVPLEPRHQPVVIDPVEERFQVQVDYPAVAGPDIGLQLPHGLMRRTVGAKSVAAVVEVGFPLRRDHLGNGLLDETIEHRRDAERALRPVRLRYFHAPDRLRAVRPRHQLRANLRPVLFQVLRQFIDRHAVDARCALVTSDLLQGTLQVRAREHAIEQRGLRNRLGDVRLSGSGFIPWTAHGRCIPVVRCVPVALHRPASSFVVRAFDRGLPAYYALC